MTARLSPQRETEIRESHPGDWYAGEWRSEYVEAISGAEPEPAYYKVFDLDSGTTLAALPDFAGPIALFITDAHDAVPALLAELAAVRAERDEAREQLAEYVGQEPTIVEEMEYLSRCLDAVWNLAAKAQQGDGTLKATDLARAAHGNPAEDPKDRRRRIYIDGNGDAWISLSHDKDIRYIGRLAGAMPADDTVDSVREATGSLREIGRCW